MTEVELTNTFGNNLAFYLEQSEMTQRDLAFRAGLSESAISNYIKKQRTPTLKAAINIANAFGIELEELIDSSSMIG